MYKINSHCEYKYVGNFPQIQKYLKLHDSDSDASMTKLGRYSFLKNPPANLDYDGLILASRAKLTDFISCSYLNDYTTLLISEKLFGLINKIKVISHVDFFPNLYDKNGNVLTKIVMMHFNQVYLDSIIFNESDLYIDVYISSPEKNKRIKLKDKEDYLNFKSKNPHSTLRFHSIVYKEDYLVFDIFKDGIVGQDLMINEKTKKMFDENGITGVYYEEVDVKFK